MCLKNNIFYMISNKEILTTSNISIGYQSNGKEIVVAKT